MHFNYKILQFYVRCTYHFMIMNYQDLAEGVAIWFIREIFVHAT